MAALLFPAGPLLDISFLTNRMNFKLRTVFALIAIFALFAGFTSRLWNKLGREQLALERLCSTVDGDVGVFSQSGAWKNLPTSRIEQVINPAATVHISNMSGEGFSSALQSVAVLTSARELHIFSCDFTAIDATTVKRNANVTTLSIVWSDGFSPAAVRYLADTFPNVQSLELCDLKTDTYTINAVRGWVNLSRLRIDHDDHDDWDDEREYLRQLSDDYWAELAATSRDLEFLQICSGDMRGNLLQFTSLSKLKELELLWVELNWYELYDFMDSSKCNVRVVCGFSNNEKQVLKSRFRDRISFR